MAPNYKLRRRAKVPASLTAAGKQITDPSKAFKNTFTRNDAVAWQAEAWHFVNTIGELRYYVGWRAASVSRCRMVASDIDPETGKPTGTCEDQRVNDIVRDIGGSSVGQSQMLKRLTTFLTAPGDGFVAMVVRDPKKTLNPDATPLDEALAATIGVTEEWLTLSRQEIKNKGTNELQLSLPDGSLHTFDPETDLLFRIWEPDAQIASEADSPVKAALPALREIERTTATIDNASKSRLVGNGILFVPQEMSLPAQNAPGVAPLDDDGGIEGGPAGPIEPWAPATSQDLQDLLFDVANTAYKDQDSMAAFLPVIASVPGEWTKNVEHLKFDSTVSETALKTRDSAIRRLAMSLDVAPERLLGMGANSNHWSAWAIGEDDVKIHIVPVLETICAAMTQFILRRKLVELNIDPDDFTIWYDTTGLTQDPDKKKEAIDAYDRGALTRQGLLQYLGFSEDDGYNLDTREGWIALAKDKAADDITLLPMLATLIGGDVSVMAEVSPPPATRDVRTPDRRPVAEEEPEEEKPKSEDGDAGEDIEPVEASALGMAKMCANRAMELAANRRMSRSDVKTVGNLPKTLAHTRLGVFTGNPFPLIEGWNSTIDGSSLIAAGLDPAAFHQVIERAAIRALSTGLPVNVTASALRKAYL